jgi:chitinase
MPVCRLDAIKWLVPMSAVRWHGGNMFPRLESLGESQMRTQGRFRRIMVLLASSLPLALGLSGCGSAGTVSSTSTPPPPPVAVTRLVGYLPDYDGSYATFASTLSFNKMTHLVLAFGLPPACNGTCTAQSDMTFALNQTDADIATLVTTAHAAGVKVMLSIGGGDNASDALIAQFYNAGLSSQLAASLDSYLAAHDLDGVDVDIEDPGIMGSNYEAFVQALISKLHGEGKIVTAAVAEWLQTQNVMSNATLHSFDFVNVMVYSNLSDCQTALAYFSSLGEPASQMTLGVPFFGESADGSIAETYATILAAYPNAWESDEVSGGTLDGGVALYYVGQATMAQETLLGKQYGGIMIWELSQDAPPPHSLLNVIQQNL